MPRTTSEQVETILDEVDTSVDLDVFIEVANELVTEKCTDSDYSDARLELIERWLAAHFYQIRVKAVGSESVRGISESYNVGQLGMILMSTTYGQQALALDTDGNLAALSKATEDGGKKTGQGWWVGTERE